MLPNSNVLQVVGRPFTALKKNPGQSTLPGLLQVVASACRLF
jgi:hypothetical protein